MREVNSESYGNWEKRSPEPLDRMLGIDRWNPGERIEIKPSEHMSSEKADKIYDEIVGRAFPEETEKQKDLTFDEEVLDEIYSRDEDEFSFDDLDLEDEKIENLLKFFTQENWDKLDYYEKQNVIRELGNALAVKLELKNPPKIIYYSGGANDCGAYDRRSNEIKINRNLINDVKETVDTLAHETFHAYQHERAEAPETKKDILYKINFDNYIRPERDADGKYVNFFAYEGQLVEAEARAFAKQFRERVGA